jgi:exodeoxyribonuclease VII small subunit
MSKKLSYSKAKEQLDQIINDLENDQISIDELTKKVKEAKGLIELCKEKLRSTQAELTEAAPES